MTTPTTADVVAAVRAAAAEHPDRRYVTNRPSFCHYHPTIGNPDGCIIGCALRISGVYDIQSADDHRQLTGFSTTPASTLLGVLQQRGYLADSDDRRAHISWLASVQGYQDRGRTWSDAVAMADKTATS